MAHAKLRPGGRIVLETINPACWFAFFESYIRDLTHVRPVHPDTLKYLMQASGFQQVEIRYRHRSRSRTSCSRSRSRPTTACWSPELPMFRDLAETFNAERREAERLLFTHLDYAAIGERL